MPIKVTCVCGQSFAANDGLAGKRVKCPKCAQPLQIPFASAPSATQPTAQPGVPAQPRPAAPQMPAQQPATASDLFDEIGLKPQATGPVCPNCRSAMAPNAILCVQCGFNVKLGRQIQTVSMSGGAGGVGGGGGHGAHGDVANTLLARAALAIDEEERAEKTKTSEGLPWWAYLLMLLGAISFLGVMRFVPATTGVAFGLVLVAFAAWMAQLYANIRILIIAFKDSVAQGLLCFFCGCYAFYYVITHWDECGSYALMAFGAWFVQFCAGTILQFLPAAAPEGEPVEESRLRRPAYIVVDRSPYALPPLLRPVVG